MEEGEVKEELVNSQLINPNFPLNSNQLRKGKQLVSSLQGLLLFFLFLGFNSIPLFFKLWIFGAHLSGYRLEGKVGENPFRKAFRKEKILSGTLGGQFPFLKSSSL